jgi:hypothetical protein
LQEDFRRGTNISSVPLLLGIKVYDKAQQDGFYGQMQVGVTHFTTSYDYGSYSNTPLTFGPGVGFHFDNLDLNFNYHILSSGYNTSGMFGLRVAAVFGSL